MRRYGAALGANHDVGIGIGQQVPIPLRVLVTSCRRGHDDNVGTIVHVQQRCSEALAGRAPQMVQQQRWGWLAEAGSDAQVAPEAPSADAVDESVGPAEVARGHQDQSRVELLWFLQSHRVCLSNVVWR